MNRDQAITETQAALAPLLSEVPSAAVIAGWTPRERADAKTWAIAARAKLGGRFGAKVPPKPDCLETYRSHWQRPSRRAMTLAGRHANRMSRR